MKKRLLLIKTLIICIILVSATFFISNVIAEDLDLQDNTYTVVYHSTCELKSTTHNYDVEKNLTEHTCTKK